MNHRQLLFLVIGVFVVGLITVTTINILSSELDLASKQGQAAIIISQPTWHDTIGYAMAQRLDDGQRTKVTIYDRKITFGSKVMIMDHDTTTSPYPVVETEPTELKNNQ